MLISKIILKYLSLIDNPFFYFIKIKENYPVSFKIGWNIYKFVNLKFDPGD